ncbi:unnamed protein product, partial [Discosporangium mesarthrocarpum]
AGGQTQSRRFVGSALACLRWCCPLRGAPHRQLLALVEALFRGGHGVAVEVACVEFALCAGAGGGMATKVASEGAATATPTPWPGPSSSPGGGGRTGGDPLYSSWLLGIVQGQAFWNLPPATRLRLLGGFDLMVAGLPSEIAGHAVREVWGRLAAFSGPSGQRGGRAEGEGQGQGQGQGQEQEEGREKPVAHGAPPCGEGLTRGSSHRVECVAEYLNALQRFVARGTRTGRDGSSGGGSGAGGSGGGGGGGGAGAVTNKASTTSRSASTSKAPSPVVMAAIVDLTVREILTSFLSAYGRTEEGGLGFLEPRAPDAPLWDGLVNLLSCLPEGRGLAAVASSGAGSAPAGDTPAERAIRAFLVGRVAAGMALRSPARSGAVSVTGAGAEGAARMGTGEGLICSPSGSLGAALRWAARLDTSEDAWVAVRPALMEALGAIAQSTQSAGGGTVSKKEEGPERPVRARWVASLLEMISLPEFCPLRTALLMCAAAVAWEDPAPCLGALTTGHWKQGGAAAVPGGRGGQVREEASWMSGAEERRKTPHQFTWDEKKGWQAGVVYAMSYAISRVVVGAEEEVLACLFKVVTSGLDRAGGGQRGLEEQATTSGARA